MSLYEFLSVSHLVLIFPQYQINSNYEQHIRFSGCLTLIFRHFVSNLGGLMCNKLPIFIVSFFN